MRRSLWVRTKQGELLAALPSFKQKIAGDEFVIVESNSLRRFMNPAITFRCWIPLTRISSSRAKQMFELSDAFILVSRPDRPPVLANTVLLASGMEKNKPCFTVREEDRFISEEVIEFVRSHFTA